MPEPTIDIDLRSRIAEAIADPQHHAVAFEDLDEVPPYSEGYLTPTEDSAVRLPDGSWLVSGVTTSIESMRADGVSFVSQKGPANDMKLLELIEQSIVPSRHLLATFEVSTEHDSGDWETGQPATAYSALGNPQILAHRLNEPDLISLYFESEVGMLGESGVYDDFAKRIEALGEDAAMAVRDKAAANRHEGLQFELNTLFDQDPTS